VLLHVEPEIQRILRRLPLQENLSRQLYIPFAKDFEADSSRRSRRDQVVVSYAYQVLLEAWASGST
jgi:hypothetical protein